MTLLLAGIMAAVLVIADQLIKYLINLNLAEGASIPIWEGVLHITHMENKGASFSMFWDQTWLLVWVTGAVLLVLAALLVLKKITKPYLVYSLSAVIAGGVGNLIDRVFRKSVTDYIHLKCINFAVFNLADCCVVIGCIMILVYVLFLDKPQAPDDTEGKDAADD